MPRPNHLRLVPDEAPTTLSNGDIWDLWGLARQRAITLEVQASLAVTTTARSVWNDEAAQWRGISERLLASRSKLEG